jgi:hypothetical protein
MGPPRGWRKLETLLGVDEEMTVFFVVSQNRTALAWMVE